MLAKDMNWLVKRAPWFAIILIGCVYLLQTASPLRLNTDVIAYLKITQSFLDGHGFLLDGKPTGLKMGYPLILAGLHGIGGAFSFSFILVNILFVAMGLLSAKYLLTQNFGISSRSALVICCMALLSFAFIKHITLPVSDPTYFGLSFLTLLSASLVAREKGVRQIAFFGGALALAILSINTRAVGITLMPPILYAVLPKGFFRWFRTNWGALTKRSATIYLTLCLMILCGVLFFIFNKLYFEEALKVFSEDITAAQLFKIKLRDWGELAANIPASKIPDMLHSGVIIIGGAFLFLFLKGVWLRRDSLNVLDIYAISYMAVLIVWPYSDARFWMQILPVAMAYVARNFESGRCAKPVLQAFAGYVGTFSLMGVAALSYSTWISLSGDNFPERYGDYNYRPSYKMAFRSAGPIDMSKVNCDMVRILNRYEPRARHGMPPPKCRNESTP